MSNATLPAEKPKKVKCPHCSVILTQGDDLCCQAIKDELNELGRVNGAIITGLTEAFNKWFKEHEVQ